MQLWLSCGLLASLCWGTYVVLNKIVTGPGHSALSSSASAFLMGIGALSVLSLYFLLTDGSLRGSSASTILMGILPGAVWALGMATVLFAIGRGAPVSKLAMVYNTNTFVAVFLAAVFLQEAPHGVDLLRVIGGAVLVTGGVILASWR